MSLIPAVLNVDRAFFGRLRFGMDITFAGRRNMNNQS